MIPTMIGMGAIAILCTTQCEVLETATMEALEWWSNIEPRAELGLDGSAWAFTVEWCDDCRYSYALPEQGRILIKRGTYTGRLPRLIAHETGHIFGMIDHYNMNPKCPYGQGIACTTLAWFSNRVSDSTRELIGWGEFTIYRVYLPSVR